MTTRTAASVPETGGAPTRVLYCVDSLIRGGTELQLLGLIERLPRDRVRPYLLTIRPTDAALRPSDCQILEWDVPKLASPSGVRSLVRLVRLLRAENIDVVHCFFQDSLIFCGLAAWIARVPVRIASFRDMGFWRTPRQDTVLRRVYPLMTHYLCNAEAVAREFQDAFGLDPSKFRVIPNGMEFPPAPERADGPVTDVVLVGNLTRRVKRADLFLQAAALVGRIHPEIQWHLVGDGELRGELERMAEDLGISERVVFAGRIDDVASYLRQAQIGVICSDSEGLSNAVLEYMAAGLASVVTDVGGNPELVDDGRTGTLVPTGDPAALADAILALVETPARVGATGRAAAVAVRDRSDWSSCLGDHLAVYGCDVAPSRARTEVDASTIEVHR